MVLQTIQFIILVKLSIARFALIKYIKYNLKWRYYLNLFSFYYISLSLFLFIISLRIFIGAGVLYNYEL